MSRKTGRLVDRVTTNHVKDKTRGILDVHIEEEESGVWDNGDNGYPQRVTYSTRSEQSADQQSSKVRIG